MIKMTVEEIKDRINELANAFVFDYNNKPCGVDPFSENDFDMWYGDDDISVDSIDKVMNTPFFDGKPLKDIVDDIENIDC